LQNTIEEKSQSAKEGMIRAFTQKKPPRQGSLRRFSRFESASSPVSGAQRIQWPETVDSLCSLPVRSVCSTSTEGPLCRTLTQVLPASLLATLECLRCRSTGATLVLRINLLIYIVKWCNETRFRPIPGQPGVFSEWRTVRELWMRESGGHLLKVSVNIVAVSTRGGNEKRGAPIGQSIKTGRQAQCRILVNGDCARQSV
jgi:hypothetical protein